MKDCLWLNNEFVGKELDYISSVHTVGCQASLGRSQTLRKNQELLLNGEVLKKRE